MSRDLRRLYAEFADIDPVTLPAPSVLRGRADRRARGLVVAGCAAVALLVGGTTVAVNAAFFRTQGPPAPGTSVTVTPTRPAPSPTPTPSSHPTPTGPIPDSAFFTQPPERASNESSDPSGDVTTLHLPSLCGATFPATVSRGRGRSMRYYGTDVIDSGVPDGTVRQSILVYRAGGAPAAMQILRTTVAACTREAVDDGAFLDYTTPSAASVGDESLLLQVRWTRPGTTWAPYTAYYSVVRLGDVITLLEFEGWEGVNVDRNLADAYTGLAVTALSGWMNGP